MHPLLYALMVGKSSEDYDCLFECIRKKLYSMKNFCVVVDFEAQIPRSILRFFDDASVYYCLFHFGQCVIRRLRTLGLIKFYKNDEKYRIYMKMFCSLAFVPPTKVLHEFKKLKNNIPIYFSNNIHDFFYIL